MIDDNEITPLGPDICSRFTLRSTRAVKNVGAKHGNRCWTFGGGTGVWCRLVGCLIKVLNTQQETRQQTTPRTTHYAPRTTHHTRHITRRRRRRRHRHLETAEPPRHQVCENQATFELRRGHTAEACANLNLD